MRSKPTTAVAVTTTIETTETPTTVKARKRARRPAPVALAPPPPPAIDLANMSADAAKKALFAAFPRQIEGKTIPATPETEQAAFEYMNARDAVQIAQGKQEIAGNVLRFACGDAESIQGDGWEVTWKTQKAEIDWGALAKELNIPSDTIEKFRKPQRRVLNVREKADE